MSTDTRSAWDAIEQTFQTRYPGVIPRQVTYGGRWIGADGDKPLVAAAAYDVGGYWHYVTFGLTDLFASEAQDVQWSGWGFELTFRLAKRTAPCDAPDWPYRLLARVAAHIWNGNPVRAADYIEFPFDAEVPGLLVLPDTDLELTVSASGAVRFTQVLALTAREVDDLRAGTSSGDVVASRIESDPLLLSRTDNTG